MEINLSCYCCNHHRRGLSESKLLKSILELVSVVIVIVLLLLIVFTFLRRRLLVIWRFILKIKLSLL
jgi:hypothetical protein